MNPYFLLGILILMMIIGHLIIHHLNAKIKQEFNEFKKTYTFPEPLSKHCENCEFYNEIYNTCENDASFGYLSEYTIFECEKERERASKKLK